MRLDWPNCRNVRDVGGLPTEDGGVVRAGALIRADSLQYLSTDGIDAVRGTGVSRILDLRSSGEIEAFPTPFTGDPLTLHRPLQDPGDPAGSPATIVEACTEMLDRHPALFAAAVRAIVDAPEGPVVVHCFGGKDRTGMVVALALTIAGVPRDQIVADYVLTQAELAAWLAEQLADLPDESRHAELIEFGDTRAESLVAILDHLDRNHGGPTAYLRRGGLTDADLAALRDRLTATG